jgi:hypothetical protein
MLLDNKSKYIFINVNKNKINVGCGKDFIQINKYIKLKVIHFDDNLVIFKEEGCLKFDTYYINLWLYKRK